MQANESNNGSNASNAGNNGNGNEPKERVINVPLKPDAKAALEACAADNGRQTNRQAAAIITDNLKAQGYLP